jgi:ABC-type multidrug transport system permease subunit
MLWIDQVKQLDNIFIFWSLSLEFSVFYDTLFFQSFMILCFESILSVFRIRYRFCICFSFAFVFQASEMIFNMHVI